MGLSEFLHFYWTENADPRTNHWPLIGSPYIMPLFSVSYLYFVLKCGPNFMKDRKPYNLKTFIKLYNIFQIVANAYFVKSFIDAGWFTTISLGCEPINYATEGGPVKLAETMWWILIVKIIDYIETFIFVLRKKNRQISFLHLYHHVSTALIQWLITKYVPGGMTTFGNLVNCSVHVIMYTYYYLTTCGPTVQKIIAPFKPMITIIQMVQFWVLMIYGIQSLLPSCPVTRIAGPLMILNLLINFFLFYNFYKKNYKEEEEKKKLLNQQQQQKKKKAN
ncbi:very long chain fatty acid elongase 4-like [Prorops nasuta]|uniref:very long chain fatty acid elongase 4-like n=1 Tax=Prorops nasuta TaxID=863751 RepID=UPI0034CFBFF9